MLDTMRIYLRDEYEIYAITEIMNDLNQMNEQDDIFQLLLFRTIVKLNSRLKKIEKDIIIS